MKTEIVNGHALLLGGECNDNLCQEVKNEGGTHLDHDTIFRVGDDVLQIEKILNDVEIEFHLPTQNVQFAAVFWCERLLENIGDIEMSLGVIDDAH